MQINWNGDAVPCCRDPNGHHVLGNVLEDGVLRTFNSRRSREFRRRILTDQGNIDICRLCSSYGMPDLTKEKPPSFSVQRHTMNPEIASTIEEAAERAVG